SDTDGGGFFYTSCDHEKLFARSKDQYDGVQPSGNSAAARNLVRLWTKTGEDRFRDQAEKSLKAFAASLKANPTSLTAMSDALGLLLEAQQGRAEKDSPQKEPFAQVSGPKKSDGVVKVTAKAVPEKPGRDGKQVVIVTLAIEKGWHI